MKILKGTLKETKYNFPISSCTAPQVIQETLYEKDQVTYMADTLGVHKISNPDPENFAVSLHCKYASCLGERGADFDSVYAS